MRSRLRQLACFWSWPFGHNWRNDFNYEGVRRNCAHCPKTRTEWGRPAAHRMGTRD
jgi:hypothetical protein